jgi:integral membrane protein (TIGR01906 family)
MRTGDRIVVFLAVTGLVLLALGIALSPLLTPVFTRSLVAAHSRTAEAGLSEPIMIETAERVRLFVVSREGTLPERVGNRPAFDESAVSHLEDVAGVLATATAATVFLALLMCGVGLAAVRVGREAQTVRALRAAGAVALVFPLLVAGVGALSFDALFAAFHSLFFASGTWTFPYDSLLIQLFPEAFWVWAGVAWGVLVMAVGASYGAIAHVIARRAQGPSN